MLRTMTALAKVDGRVSAFLEPIALYMTKDLHAADDGQWTFSYPSPEEYMTPFEPRIYDEQADDLLIITYGNGVPMALRTAARLADAHEVKVRTIDLRWLKPLNTEAIAEHARQCAGVIVFDEGRPDGGVGEAVCTALVEAGVADRPVRRLTGADCYIPLADAANLVLAGEDELMSQLDFRRSIGAIAQFVLQSLDQDGVLSTIGLPARHEQTGQPPGSLGQNEKTIAHGGRAEPLVARQPILPPRPPARHRTGPGGIGRHIRTALLFRHRHAQGGAGLFVPGAIVAIVLSAAQQGLPLPGQLGLMAQSRHRREGHAERTAAAGIQLMLQIEMGGPDDMATPVVGVLPGQPRHAHAYPCFQQPVIAFVVFHHVNSVPLRVMTAEHRRTALRPPGSAAQFFPQSLAVPFQAGERPACPGALQPLLQ